MTRDTPIISDTDLGPILYQALAEPIGVLLRTSNSKQTIKRLYATRGRIADPALRQLTFLRVFMENGCDVAIVSRGVADV